MTAMPCQSDFKNPYDEPEGPDLHMLTGERMDRLDVDTLSDALNVAGSEHKTMSLLAEFVGGEKWDDEKRNALYLSIYDDVYLLVKKEIEEKNRESYAL